MEGILREAIQTPSGILYRLRIPRMSDEERVGDAPKPRDLSQKCACIRTSLGTRLG